MLSDVASARVLISYAVSTIKAIKEAVVFRLLPLEVKYPAAHSHSGSHF
jgi:hypothetical protein